MAHLREIIIIYNGGLNQYLLCNCYRPN